MMSKPENNIEKICYKPESNCNLLQFSVLRIRVKVRQHHPGVSAPFRVIIRTNLNQVRRIRRQIIDQVEKAEAILRIFTTYILDSTGEVTNTVSISC